MPVSENAAVARLARIPVTPTGMVPRNRASGRPVRLDEDHGGVTVFGTEVGAEDCRRAIRSVQRP
jgi:hypothetical protein